ncbi:MAG: alpha-2-macroglobulin, partial [Chitinophagaceae bacterium]|nr:alpha-2-macroglobulin [Chitinophagaceae bacterium]
MNLPVVRACVVSMFLLLFSFSNSHAQSTIKTYDKQWKVVADFVKKQLPKSALVEVKKIYALAKQENQDAQVIKSLVYMIDLQAENRDNNDLLSIADVEKELAVSKQPATSILNSLLADLYWRYYNNYRWQMYSRTQTVLFKKEDIATWGTEDFHRKISTLYLASIQEERLLQQTRLEPFNAIILKGNVRHLRPTLYDLLADRALDYFKNDERDLRKPAYAFQIDQPEAFATAEEFSRYRFPTRDSFSLQHKALLVYQKLLAFHLSDARPDALLDADIQRILFVRSKSVHPERDKLYFSALERIANKYGNLPAASQAWFFMASYHEEKANSYSPFGDTTHRFARLKARDILERILAQKDSSEGKTNSYNLLSQIKKQQLQFNVEKVNLPQQPFRALVSYRNFTQVYFRLVKQDDKIKKE